MTTPTTPKLKPEIKAEWLAALRGGEYEQGQGLLRRDNHLKKGQSQYCCLGVLCDLLVKKGIGQWVFDDEENGWMYADQAGMLNDISLTEATLEKIGVGVEVGSEMRVDHDGGYLTTMNDQGKSFATIAQVIEEQF